MRDELQPYQETILKRLVGWTKEGNVRDMSIATGVDFRFAARDFAEKMAYSQRLLESLGGLPVVAAYYDEFPPEGVGHCAHPEDSRVPPPYDGSAADPEDWACLDCGHSTVAVREAAAQQGLAEWPMLRDVRGMTFGVFVNVDRSQYFPDHSVSIEAAVDHDVSDADLLKGLFVALAAARSRLPRHRKLSWEIGPEVRYRVSRVSTLSTGLAYGGRDGVAVTSTLLGLPLEWPAPRPDPWRLALVARP